MATLTMTCRCGGKDIFTGTDIKKLEQSARKFQRKHSGADCSFAKTPKAAKYKNRKVELDGHTFDSQREANRYLELKLLVRAGDITDLKLQVPFECQSEGVLIETYIADFTYTDRAGNSVVEDAKGCITPTYRRKRRWMKQLHGITILET